MSIIDKIGSEECWESFLDYKRKNVHIFESELADLESYVKNREYLPVLEKIRQGEPMPLPQLREINKKGSDKKRKVFVFPRQENYVFKLIAFLLHDRESMLCPNLYSFRRGVGVKQAIEYLSNNPAVMGAYTYKVDIHDYFNSVDTESVLSVLKNALSDDPELYSLIAKVLREKKVRYLGKICECKKGIMAGVPFSGYLANLYLSDMDRLFYDNNVVYARYSDDIIVFANTEADIRSHEQTIKEYLASKHLTINQKKEFRTSPDEAWEFLGLSVKGREVDIARVSVEKIKAKMRRKARSLLRWKKRSGASDKGAARAFIRHFNRKIFDNPSLHDTTWALWYFPIITTPASLKIIDEYAVSCIRYIVSGKHTKSNYNLRYSTLKEWGYVNLVNSYYKFVNEGKLPSA